MKYQALVKRLKESRLFKDSFWAVFGNGMGFGLMLLAGILIARFLGKDLYGEYGMVKTTMFQVAAFATFGLGYTSTRFVAKAKREDPSQICGIVHSSFLITIASSSVLAILLFIFAYPLAEFIEEPSLALAFRLLGVITILKALLTTQNGVLAGLGDFKGLARNNVISGLSLLVLCVPLTVLFSVKGSLLALALSQFINLVLNFFLLKKEKLIAWNEWQFSKLKELLRFSIPVALQELTFSLSYWLTSLILVKMTTMGELGVYSAAAQWNTVVLFVPSLLSNVILSHLSGNVSNKKHHQRTIQMALCMNLCCTLLPFLIVYFSTDFIYTLYGPSFSSLPTVLRISLFSTILSCLGNVFNNEMISQGRTWVTFFARSTRDILGVVVVYYLLLISEGIGGARQVAYAHLISGAYYLFCYILAYCMSNKKDRYTETLG